MKRIFLLGMALVGVQNVAAVNGEIRLFFGSSSVTPVARVDAGEGRLAFPRPVCPRLRP